MKSVVKFGVGAWDQVKEDQELELTSKILPTSDDATPQVIFDLFEILADLSKLSAASYIYAFDKFYSRQYLNFN